MKGQGVRVPTDEREWNRAIFNWYFGPNVAGRPVYLSFDDATAKAVAAAEGWPQSDALAALRSCLRVYLDQAHPFADWDERARRWEARKTEEPPPFIHLLALTVLPATERRDTGTANGYYKPLFATLGIDDTPGRREDYREHVPNLWIQLGRWLTGRAGAYGLPTAKHGTHATAYLGYSRSQAIVRSVDRAAFIDFFEQAGYAPGESIASNLLLARFERWATRSAVSDRVQTALADDELRKALEEILRHDLETWTGESRDDDFRLVLRVLPRLNATRRNLTAVLRCPPGFRGLFDDGVEIAPAGDERVFLSRTIILEPRSRRETFEVGGVRLQLRHSTLHAFEEDPLLGGYTAVDRMTRGRTAWLAVASTAERELGFLAHANYKTEQWPSLPGWSIVRDFRPSFGPADGIPEGIERILPPSGMRAELRGGLPLGHSHYLVGGAPDLFVPESPLGLDAILSGRRFRSIPAGRETLVQLAETLNEPGKFNLEIGDQNFRFQVEASGLPTAREDEICHVMLQTPPTLLDLCKREFTMSEDCTIAGAVVDPDPSTQRYVGSSRAPTDGWILFDKSAEYAVLAPGPAWLGLVNQSPCHMADDEVPSRVDHATVWIARLMAGRAHVRQIGSDATRELNIEPVPFFGDRTIRVAERDVNAWTLFASQLPCDEVMLGKSAPGAPRHAEPLDELSAVERSLAWCSERGHSPITSFVETFQWLDGNSSDSKRAYWALRSLNRLGHIEVDWHRHRLAITRPTLVAPFNSGGLAFLTGLRTDRLRVEIERVIADRHLDIVVVEAAQLVEAPRLIVFRAGMRRDLEQLADGVGLRLAVDLNGSLSALLPTVDRMVRTGRLAGGFERRKVDAGPAGVRLTPVHDDSWTGSYEHDTFGAKVYSIRESDQDKSPYLIDRSTAIWYSLRKGNLYPVTHDPRAQTLSIRTDFGLPLLHDRCLIMATGMLPSVRRVDGVSHYVYSNISTVCATRLKEALSR